MRNEVGFVEKVAITLTKESAVRMFEEARRFDDRSSMIRALEALANNPTFDQGWKGPGDQPLYSQVCMAIARAYGELTNYDAMYQWEKKVPGLPFAQRRHRN